MSTMEREGLIRIGSLQIRARSKGLSNMDSTEIKKGEMTEVLLAACPSFQPTWDAFLEEWTDKPVDLPLYLVLADFARHLIGMLGRCETESFPAIFLAIERLHCEGDHYVREAATVGLLEDLQNTNQHSTTEPEQFREYLGPESDRWWEELIGFWERGEPLL
jgi:hypothetical protein